MDVGLVTILLFSSLFILLLTGLPLAFCLGVVALIFTYFLWGSAAVMQVASACFGATLNIILIACPLFIFMANVLQFSGLADRLYDMIYTWSGRISGGLAMGTVFICAVFAAMSGISGAATVSMGIIAIPSMLTRKYDKFLSVGCVAAGGALGILIPPSITMIVYASMTGVSVGQLFMAGVLPGMLLAGMFIVYIAVRCLISPELGPPLPPEERRDWPEKFKSLGAVVLPLILVLSVIGSILLGLATPTEAAAVGAVGSLVCAALNRKLMIRLAHLGTMAALYLALARFGLIGFAFAFLIVEAGFYFLYAAAVTRLVTIDAREFVRCHRIVFVAAVSTGLGILATTELLHFAGAGPALILPLQIATGAMMLALQLVLFPTARISADLANRLENGFRTDNDSRAKLKRFLGWYINRLKQRGIPGYAPLHTATPLPKG